MVALIVAFVAYAPGPPVARHRQRQRPVQRLRHRDGRRRRCAHRLLCARWRSLGVKTVGLYGFAVALSPLPGVLVGQGRGPLRTEPGPESTWDEVTPNLGWLLLGSVFAAALVNAGPMAADAAGRPTTRSTWSPSSRYGVLLARIPLFLFQAVQAALLPRLVAPRGAQRARRVPLRLRAGC